jgi:uncharacterized protein (TIGR00251 family)
VATEQDPFRVTEAGISLRVKVLPGAKRNRIEGQRNAELLVRIRAPALRGKANAQLVKYLAEEMSLTRSQIQILSGETSRHKVLLLPAAAMARLIEVL